MSEESHERSETGQLKGTACVGGSCVDFWTTTFSILSYGECNLFFVPLTMLHIMIPNRGIREKCNIGIIFHRYVMFDKLIIQISSENVTFYTVL
jgi:hypothetical protein